MDINRSKEQQKQHYYATVQRFRMSMRDKAKLFILSYMEQNPSWTPEELKHIINIGIKQYGLNSRYVPDLSKASVAALGGEESKVEQQANDPDNERTEAAPSN